MAGGNAHKNSQDIENGKKSETSSLLAAKFNGIEGNDTPPSGVESDTELSGSGEGSTGTNRDGDLWDELDSPWPATFDRAVGLLASPVINKQQVDHFTKSPKPGGTPIAIRARIKRQQRLRAQGHGIADSPAGYGGAQLSQTPPAGSTYLLGPKDKRSAFKRQSSHDDIEEIVASGKSKKKGPASISLEEVKSKLSLKAKKQNDAKAYRQEILKKQQQLQKKQTLSSQIDSSCAKSPGFYREQETLKYQRQQQQHDTSSGVELVNGIPPSPASAASGGSSIGHSKATFSQSLFNMANILMGVGLLGLPFVYKSSGWIGGFFVTFFFGFVTWKTSIMLGRELNGDPRPNSMFVDSPYKSPIVPGSSDPMARMRKPIKTFPDIAREAFGDTGCFILSVVLYFELFSCLSIFLVSLGDHLHVLFPTVAETTHSMIVALLLIIPTALLRTPTLLSYLSMVGTFATVAVVLSVFLSVVIDGDVTGEIAASEREQGTLMKDASSPYRDIWRTQGLPTAFGLVAYTFSGHALVPSIYSSMSKPQEFERMIDYTFLIVIGCSLVVAISGYMMFGTFVDDQVTLTLENYAEQSGSTSGSDIAMKMLTWLMILTSFSKYTLTMFPLALGVEEIVAPYITSDKLMDVTSAIVKIILTILALVVAIYVPSFSFLCSLVGMICTMSVSVIFPAGAHLKLFYPRLTLFEKMLDWVFIIFGSVMAVVGTIATIE